MPGSTFAPVERIDHERTQWTHAEERWAEQRRLVCLVATTYRAMHSLQPVRAMNLDPDVREREGLWTPESCHYRVDVENTVRRVIESKPESERPALWAAWEHLLEDDAKIGRTEKKLIQALAPKFFANRMHPSQYFKPNRYPHKRGAR